MKIYLIGMPGSGKTTLGKQVASELGLDFVDLDAEIESREKLSIPEIFRTKGEGHFRLSESALLAEWAASSKDFVMATGGGTPCFHNGIDIINQSGLSVYLNAPIEKLSARVQGESNRPLLNTESAHEVRSKLQQLLAQRAPIYSRAKVIVEDPTLNSILQKLRFKK